MPEAKSTAKDVARSLLTWVYLIPSSTGTGVIKLNTEEQAMGNLSNSLFCKPGQLCNDALADVAAIGAPLDPACSLTEAGMRHEKHVLTAFSESTVRPKNNTLLVLINIFLIFFGSYQLARGGRRV